MKSIFTFLLLLSGICYSFSQSNKISQMVSYIDREKISDYNFRKSLPFITITSGFSSDVMELPELDTLTIIEVDYVYTQYHESSDFKQKELDKVRLERFASAYPNVMNNPLVKWRFFEQTGCQSLEECSQFFHGFVIYYRPLPTFESRAEELRLFEEAMEELDSAVYSSSTVKIPYTTYKSCAYPSLRQSISYIAKKFKDKFSCEKKLKGKYEIVYDLDAKGKIVDVKMPGLEHPCKESLLTFFKNNLSFVPARLNNRKFAGQLEGTVSFPLSKKSFVFNKFEFPEYLKKHYTISTSDKFECKACRMDTIVTLPRRSDAVSSVLKRNEKWTYDLVVVDITGSMSPYITDLMTWIRLKTLSEPKQFVFFNDGDLKVDEQKKVGSTGGIYKIRSGDFIEVKATLIKAMYNGFGGDCPENNFEALLEGVKECPECTDIVMVADNYAFPRDEALLAKYKGKLKIILCGTDYGINEAYLNLARKYKFTLHTLKSDLINLFEINEGQTVTIEGVKYVIKKGQFKKVMDI